MGRSIQEWTKSEICGRQPLSRPYHFKLFKDCLALQSISGFPTNKCLAKVNCNSKLQKKQ